MDGVIGNCSTVAGVARKAEAAMLGLSGLSGLWGKLAFGTVFPIGGGRFVAFFAQMQLAVVQFCLIIFWGGFVNRNGVVVLLHRD